ncbi:MAG: DUF3696 domain-containing protein [Candidatus Dadabacteria bacterium]|nr:DUF3696 domain-containing protein [Candidatus Dadabacteria bacterium]
MIDSMRIKNFKCFRDESVSLKPLTVLSGINGMGKSTFIQILLFLRQWGFQLSGDNHARANLNGPLVNFGYTEDVLHEKAEEKGEDIILAIGGDGSEKEYRFSCPDGEKWIESLSGKPLDTSDSLLGESFYYLGAERIGPRLSFLSSNLGGGEKRINAIGNSGEYCAWLLANAERDSVENDSRIHPDESIYELRAQVEAWLSEIGQSARIHLNNHKDMDRVSLQFSFVRDRITSRYYRPTNVGFGLTYALPIFVAGLLSKKGGLVIIENPEAHLHPKGQSVLGKFLSGVANSGVQVIVETHSDHLLNGIRISAKNGEIDSESVALHFFQRDEGDQSTKIVTPKMDKNGRLNEWPEGFFDEWESSLTELL